MPTTSCAFAAPSPRLRGHSSREHTTLKRVREALEGEYGLEPGTLKEFKDVIAKTVDDALEDLDNEGEQWEPPTAAEQAAAAERAARRAAEAVPRVLTLGSDTEALRREGQRLEAKYGRDAGNGWAYNHALGKLRLYQEKLLTERFGEEPSGPSVRELEAEDDQ